MKLTNEQAVFLEKFLPGRVWEWRRVPSDDTVIHFLQDEGFIRSREDLCEGMMCITEKGKQALYEFYGDAHNNSKDEAQRRFQNKISVAHVLVPLITFILGLIVEHFSGFIGKFLELLW